MPTAPAATRATDRPNQASHRHITTDPTSQIGPPKTKSSHIPDTHPTNDATPAMAAIDDAQKGVAPSTARASLAAITENANAMTAKPLPLPSAYFHQDSKTCRSPAIAASKITVASDTAVLVVHSAPTGSNAHADSVSQSCVRRESAVSTIKLATAKDDSEKAAAKFVSDLKKAGIDSFTFTSEVGEEVAPLK